MDHIWVGCSLAFATVVSSSAVVRKLDAQQKQKHVLPFSVSMDSKS